MDKHAKKEKMFEKSIDKNQKSQYNKNEHFFMF